DSIPAAAADGERQGEPGARLVMLDNIIVNPAGSRGTRFLMASVALEVADEELQRRLAEQDVQLRDAVTSLLERQTMESLTLPGARDSLKRHIAAAVAPFVGDRRLRVYLPQFVIQ
ncbi:MAG TPA: flagellar basal body-associated FliL family protein, partial [Gemmatimonadales bacterium]|nr:flagellar basal body-associated FliL family protein [Gemmatimonadales bacterium]